MSTIYPTKFIHATFPFESVLLLTMNRKPVNAFNDALWFELGEMVTIASSDNNVRVIVLASGLEKLFTAGLDLTESALGSMTSSDPGRTALLLRKHIGELQDAVSALELCDKPIIAAIHGACFGGGIDIIAAADIRYAAEGTIFSIKEVDVGLAADVGSLSRLGPKVSNDSLLRELAFTARNFSPSEAEKLGLISKTVTGGRDGVLKASLELAKIIAAKSPIATLGTKVIMNYSQGRTVQEGIDFAKLWNMAMLQADDLPVAFKAFATKQPPTYKKLGKL